MKDKYYNGANLLNADCPINFSIGNRSAGKSYYWKRYCIKRFLKNGEQFIYLRRHENDLDMSKGKFFEDISNEFPNHTLRVDGNKFILGRKNNGKIMEEYLVGYCFSLSILHKIKSIPLEKVCTIFFDEFIPDNLQYLKPLDPSYEPTLLMSLYMTVARGYNRPIRDEVKIICAANMVTMYNPYFTFFEIDLTNKDRVKQNNVYAEKIQQTEISEEIKNSKIGKILERTQYGDYALNNTPLKDDTGHIVQHPNDAVPYFMLFCYKWYICYYDTYGNIYFALGYDKTFKRKYKVVNIPDSNEEIPWFKGDIVKTIKKVLENDKIYYESMSIKSSLAGLFTPKI